MEEVLNHFKSYDARFEALEKNTCNVAAQLRNAEEEQYKGEEERVAAHQSLSRVVESHANTLARQVGKKYHKLLKIRMKMEISNSKPETLNPKPSTL